MVLCHQWLILTGQITNTSYHKGWVRVPHSFYPCGRKLGLWGGGEESQGSTPCMEHCLLNSNLVGNLGGDSFEGNIPGSSPSLYEASFKNSKTSSGL